MRRFAIEASSVPVYGFFTSAASELAVVSSANPNPESLSRPIVKIISDAQGNRISPPLQVDLAVPEAGGQYARTIIKTADPERYGITPGDYLI